jgi:16S rRNA (uracil1498-N3)-methyltransferase
VPELAATENLRRVVAHVFVDDLARPVLNDQDVHHLSRVLRLKAGEHVSASDGKGGTRLCQWCGTATAWPVGPGVGPGTIGAGPGTIGVGPRASRRGAVGPGATALEPLADEVREPRSLPQLTVAFALTKGDRTEWAVQKLTELGVDRLVVMASERCVVHWAPPSVGRQLERLREVARHAAMQSRRAWLPVVEGPVTFAEMASCPLAEDAGDGLAVAVPGGDPLTLATPTVLVGPEGGWSDAELALVPRRVGLGPHVLRAETASLAAGALLAALRAGLVAPARVVDADRRR